ncbi:Ig-like domain-containing protein [Sphingomonas sp. KRR8]|uniref:Ig-like domain-containing protein n=1 Tax=Sphingomonas sp. KRR8 TaxID=2942996 RepID=UPI00201FE2AA|nr:Ig-like domain-containing protein [Sphingomonas sp. KRR8]URD61544.1 Ig-like domain-containing protein [Sphingomonas sp. KRR8]
MGTISAMDAAWQTLKVGAGGFITGIDVAPDGTMVARTDTYGAYIWNGTGWTQLVTAASMPSGTFAAAGVYEIRISASNTNVIYMTMADGLYKSVDRGGTWIKTSFPVHSTDPNTNDRMNGEKMAVDPTNSNVVYAGTQKDGLWVTRDGGTTWAKITAVPQGSNTTDTDLTGITIKGANVFVATAGSGVYMSSDSGVTWKSIGGPADVANAAVSSDGSYYATGNSDGTLWKYSNGSWTKLLTDSNNGVHGIAIDPFDSTHLVVSTPGGTIQESHDGGASWSGWSWYGQLESTNDVPWLETTSKYMGVGGLVFDPLVPGQLWQSAGVGVWNTQIPSQLVWNQPYTWTSHSAGIEQLVANDIIAPAGGDPILGSWDRAFIDVSNPDAYATSYSGGSFSMGWSLDYASTNSTFVVGISDWWGQENSGFSTDGGKTWQKFAGLPSWATSTIGGSIAASTPTNFIWVATGNQPPAYTLDGGTTWTNVNIAGITDWSGLNYFYYLDRTSVTADRVLANTFYLYDCNSGLYRTTDGGVSWTKVYNGQISDWSYWNAKIEAVPGSAGELFFTSGPQGSDPSAQPSTTAFMHSKDGGATWQTVTGVGAITFGYGAAATAGGPATIYIVGTVNGKYGVWYSTDDAATWTQIGDHPMGSLDTIKTISGDMDQFGRVYIGFTGSGYAYLDVGATSAPLTTATQPAQVAPTTQVAIMDITDDAKGIAMPTGSLTNDKTPLLHGTLTAALTSDQTVAVYRDGVKIGIATTSGTGWAFTDPGATDGSHNYTARVESTSGLSGNYSPPFNLRVDATAPTQTVATTSAVDDFGASTGTLASGAITDDHSPLIKGTLSAALGADESLVVYRDGVRLGTAVVSGSGWSFADSNVADGQHSYVARVEDAAGNQGTAAAAFSLQVKSSAPSETALIKLAVDDFGTMKGNLLSGATTDDTSPLLKGTLSASLNTGEQLVVYRDGVRLGAASVTGTDWSFADKGVSKGAHVYTSQVEDAAGQKSAPSAGFYLSISNQKGVKAAVMSSYSLSSTGTGTSTSETSLTSSTGTFTKYSLAANDLLDTSSFSATKLTLASSTFETAFDMKSGNLSSLKLAAAALVDGSADGHGFVPSHASDDSGIDLVGSWNQHGVHHWIA